MKSMKKRLLTSAVTLLMALAAFGYIFAAANPSHAYENYHVTVSGGLHGKVNGAAQEDVYIGAGREWNPNDYTVEVDDDRYYFKGFHISGIEGTLEGAQAVNEDRVYVATYGIKGGLVAYTVNFVDASGKTLSPSITVYGKPGDKPVVAYRYIDGYIPQAYNLTKTLSEDESANVFTFTYTENEAVEGGTTAGEPGTSQGGGDDAGGANGNGAGGAGGNGNLPAGVINGGAGNQVNGNNGQPSQIVDLDDDDTPTTDGSGNKDGKSDDGKGGKPDTIIDDKPPKAGGESGFFRPWMWIPIAAVIAAVIAFIVMGMKKRSRS